MKEARGSCDDLDVTQLYADVSFDPNLHSQGAVDIGARAKYKILVGTPRTLLRSSFSSNEYVDAPGNQLRMYDGGTTELIKIESSVSGRNGGFGRSLGLGGKCRPGLCSPPIRLPLPGRTPMVRTLANRTFRMEM